MSSYSKFSRTTFYIWLFIVLISPSIVAGCEDNYAKPTSVTAGDNTVDILAGHYDFIRYEFVPDDSTIAPVNMLDTLIASTELWLGSDERFVLNYRLRGRAQRAVAGTMKVSQDDVLLHPEEGNGKVLKGLLLGDRITLNRDSLQLRASVSSKVDLSPRFAFNEGLSPTEGTLELRLKPRASN